MRAEIRTPFTTSTARTVQPDTWRKRVLPVGEINYKGRVLNFDIPYLEKLAASFGNGAYDQVPFQLADAQNTHTNDPERYRGEVIGMDVRPDGLWITAKTTPAGSRLLSTNPKLGVSARIVEEYERADGEHFTAAVQHVLGTLDPRIPQLGSWEAVEMSNDEPDQIIDLSAATFAEQEEGSITMPELDADQQSRLAALLDLDPAKLDALIAGMDGAGDYEVPEPTDDELAAMIAEMDDETFGQLMESYGIVAEPAALANGAMTDIELTNYRMAEQQRQVDALQSRLDAQTYANDKRTLVNAGVPPYIVEMARELLEGAGHVVELANGKGVDAGRVMREVLLEFGKAHSMYDFGTELGSAMDEPDTTATAEESRRDFVSQYRRATGI